MGTCGTNLSKFVIPVFALLSTFLLLNLSAAIMIEALKTAHRFSGNRALLTKHMTKKRLSVIWDLWQKNAQNRGTDIRERPQLGKLLITVHRANDLPDLYYTRPVQVYCSLVLHAAYRRTGLHPPSSCPEWNEGFTVAVHSLPTFLVLRLFDRNESSEAETFVGEARIQLSHLLLHAPKKASNEGGVCVSEEWYALRGMRSGGLPATGRIKVSLDYYPSVGTFAGRCVCMRVCVCVCIPACEPEWHHESLKVSQLDLAGWPKRRRRVSTYRPRPSIPAVLASMGCSVLNCLSSLKTMSCLVSLLVRG